VERLIVDGATIVDGGVSTRVDAVAVTRALEKATRRVVERAGGAR
jgi:hypothetical protein